MKLDPETCAAHLVANLNDQMEHYGIIAALARRQIQFIENDVPAGLNLIVRKREYHLRRIAVRNREAEGLKKYYDETRVSWPEPTARAVDEAIRALTRLMGALLKTDAELRALVIRRKEELQSEIGRFRAARKFAQAYSHAPSNRLLRFANRRA